jgi:hypothetical protein
VSKDANQIKLMNVQSERFSLVISHTHKYRTKKVVPTSNHTSHPDDHLSLTFRLPQAHVSLTAADPCTADECCAATPAVGTCSGSHADDAACAALSGFDAKNTAFPMGFACATDPCTAKERRAATAELQNLFSAPWLKTKKQKKKERQGAPPPAAVLPATVPGGSPATCSTSLDVDEPQPEPPQLGVDKTA